MRTRPESPSVGSAADEGSSRRVASGGGALFVLLLLAPLALRTQEDPLQEPRNAPLYEIEVIAFRHLDQRGNTPETDSGGPGGTETGRMPGAQNQGQIEPALQVDYPPLGPQALRLGGIAAKLRGGSYQLLYHGGWSQAVDRQNQARATPLPADAAAQDLSGAITLYRERYLYVVVDVALAGDTALRRIRQTRRIRGQAAQYFDHPQFGVILSVRPASGRANE
jgi:hypothetical protein